MEEEYQIIRGKRINDQLELLVEQSTYNQLKGNVDSFIPISTKRQNAIDPVQIVEMQTLPFLGTKNLNVDSRAQNSDSKQGRSEFYPKIIFNQVEFEEESTNENITFTAKDGNEYNMQAIDLGKSTLRVRCTCGDFLWRFAAFNAKDKSLIGTAPKPYQNKTNRGPVNPRQVPGVCKHLIKTIEALKQSGMVR